MIDDMQLVVTRKYHQKAEDTGVVQIICGINSSGIIKSIEKDAFPLGVIWISKGYDRVEQDFKNGELFILDFYEKITSDINQAGVELDSIDGQLSHDKASHWSLGKYAKKLEADKLIPVLKADLPEISTGLFNWNGPNFPNGQFYIENDEHIYGPFTGAPTEDEYVAMAAQCLPLGLQQNYVAKVPKKLMIEHEVLVYSESFNSNIFSGYITSNKDLAEKLKTKIETIDYINNSHLITFFAKNGLGEASSKLGRKPAEQLKQAISEEAKKKHKLKDNDRLKRLEEILDDYLSNKEFGWDIIDRWLNTENGKSFLSELVDENPNIVSPYTENLTVESSGLKEEIEQLKLDKRREESELDSIKNKVFEEKNKAEKEIEKFHQQTEQQMEAERKEVISELEKKIAESRTQYSSLQDEIEAETIKLKNLRNIDELNKEVEYLERRRSELRSAVDEQEKLLKSPDLTKEVVRSDTILGLLQGRDFMRQDTEVKYSGSTLCKAPPKEGSEVIQSIVNKFEDSGRTFTFEEMANLLITTQQSFMTVLKGLPGAGKTSTAIRLAEAHKIAGRSMVSDDFLNIPVSRGWVSGRDFLGFYNSLKGSYQPSKTGLYQFLSQGQAPSSSKNIRVVLLDEANLSPIEHYMSDFLGLFDNEGRDRPIDTGINDIEKRYLSVPKNLRFIATINNDSTTEPLSPRLCDRVPIISMDMHDQQSIRSADAFNMDGALPYEVLEVFFGSKGDDYDDLPTKVQLIVALFGDHDKELGLPIVVSKRKINAMLNYFAVAREYMDETLAEDFAISQYMLPLINGFGSKYKNRLLKIKDQAQRSNLNRTEQLLDNIITTGDNHIGSYSYF